MYLSYALRLASLKLESLHVRRIKQDLIMCFKIINGLVAIDCSDFFTLVKCDRTRGHNFKLYINDCRLDVRKFSFARRVCPIWNKLPCDIVNAVSLNSFRFKLRSVNFDTCY